MSGSPSLRICFVQILDHFEGELSGNCSDTETCQWEMENMPYEYLTSPNLRSLNQTEGTEGSLTQISTSSNEINASLIILSVEIGLTFFGNTALLRSLRNSRQRDTAYRDLLQNLCVIGTLASLTGMPSLFATVFLSFIKWRAVPSFLCRLRYFSLTYFFIADSINICCLSLERYDFVSRPFRKRIRKQNIKRIISITWVIPLFIALPHLVIKINSLHCVFVTTLEGPYSGPMVVLLSIILILTCIFVVVTNWSSFKSLRILSRRLNACRKRRATTERKMIFLTINIVATYLLSLAPMALWTLVLRVANIKICPFCNDIQIYLQLLVFVRYMANPFIFMGFVWKRKEKKIGVLKKPTGRYRGRELVNGNIEPCVLFPFTGDVLYLKRRHQNREFPRLEASVHLGVRESQLHVVT